MPQLMPPTEGPINLETAFVNRQPSPAQTQRYDRLLGKTSDFAAALIKECGGSQSREVQLALTYLQQAAFWAHAAIMTNETGHAGTAKS